jgi:hypothetical protein
VTVALGRSVVWQGNQQELNKSEFAELTPAEQERLEGFKVGTYVRMELAGIPAEIFKNRDPRVPMVCGMLKPEEEQMGFIQVPLQPRFRMACRAFRILWCGLAACLMLHAAGCCLCAHAYLRYRSRSRSTVGTSASSRLTTH